MEDENKQLLTEALPEAEKRNIPRPERPLQTALKGYLSKHLHFNQVFAKRTEQSSIPKREKKPVSLIFRVLLSLLKLSPWIVLITFGLSFWVDFGPQHTLTVFGYTLPLDSLVRIISVSGLIGFFTNWLAIKMLFKPVERRPIWGQGLIPAQRDIIIAQLAGGIHKNILSEELIAQRIEASGIINRMNDMIVKGAKNLLHDPEFREEVKSIVYWQLKDYLARTEVQELLSQKIDEKLENKFKSGFKGLLFKTYRKLKPTEYQAVLQSVIQNIPETSVEGMEELEKKVPELSAFLEEKQDEMEAFFTRFVMDILERVDIYKLLQTQMEHFDEAKLERLIWTSTSEQLVYIQYLGTILGMLGGLLIWQPVPVLITYTSLFSLLYIADLILYKIKHKSP